MKKTTSKVLRTSRPDTDPPLPYRDIEISDDVKREMNTKRKVIDKETGKEKEVDMYDRDGHSHKKKDPEKLKAICSSNLEQSIMPKDVSNLN